MSKFEEAVEKYTAESNRLNLGLSQDFLTSVAKSLGPSIYNTDSSLVSSGDSEELNRVKENFLIKKLGLSDGPHLDKAIDETIETLGRSNRNKHRVLFYALLAKKFNKEDIYK